MGLVTKVLWVFVGIDVTTMAYAIRDGRFSLAIAAAAAAVYCGLLAESKGGAFTRMAQAQMRGEGDDNR